MKYEVTRPLRGHVVGGGAVDLGIGAVITKKGQDRFTVTRTSAVRLDPPTLFLTKIEFTLNAHIASTDLKEYQP